MSCTVCQAAVTDQRRRTLQDPSLLMLLHNNETKPAQVSTGPLAITRVVADVKDVAAVASVICSCRAGKCVCENLAIPKHVARSMVWPAHTASLAHFYAHFVRPPVRASKLKGDEGGQHDSCR